MMTKMRIIDMMMTDDDDDADNDDDDDDDDDDDGDGDDDDNNDVNEKIISRCISSICVCVNGNNTYSTMLTLKIKSVLTYRLNPRLRKLEGRLDNPLTSRIHTCRISYLGKSIWHMSFCMVS